MKRSFWLVGLLVGLSLALWSASTWAQGEAAPAPAAGAAAPAAGAGGDAAAPAEEGGGGGHGSELGLKSVILRSGWFGLIIWVLLLAASFISLGLIVDSFITIRASHIAPPALVTTVRQAMEQGDLVAAIGACEVSVTPLSRILMAGFLNVEDGYEVVQDAVGVAADIEAETLLGRVSYLSVISNTTPMLGLIGTVQGMIYAFFTLGTQEAGAAQQAMLAVNISHGLWATAVGLGVSVPAAILFYYFKNKTNRIILGMEALTLEVTKSLRNVEVVEEGDK